MSTVFKKFSKSDVSITPFTAHKKVIFRSASLASNGGSFYSASFPTTAYKEGANFGWANSGSENDVNNHKKYFQLDHLFYKNYKLDYSNKFSTTKYNKQKRVLYKDVNILSLPYKTIGYKIKPGSFNILMDSGTSYIDDGEGNIISTTGSITDASDPGNSSRVFYLGPVNGFKKENLNIENGKQLINFESLYSSKDLDDSHLFNEIEYRNITFNSEFIVSNVGQKTYTFPLMTFNGENSTVVSPHNSRLNFNSGDDFTITLRMRAEGFDLDEGVTGSLKRYIISKSTTKTIIPSPNLINSTKLSGSSKERDIEAEPQFPFEIYHQSNSIFFRRSDGNKITEISQSNPQDHFFNTFMSFIKTGSTLQIWNKDTKVAETTDITTQCQNQANLYIGSKGGTSNFWTGSIGQIGIYEKALNERELKSLKEVPDGSHTKVGNIFYNTGLVTITNPTALSGIFNPSSNTDFNLSYEGTHLIYENEYQCMAEQHEFDITLNPSARKIKSKDSEDLSNFATGSNFKPYVTTVGLYNDNGELLVVGKLGQAIRMTDEADTTYVVRFDT